MSSALIGSNSLISLNFAIKLSDGSVVDSNFEQAPCSFKYGDGSLLPGFEQSLLGLRSGERKSVLLPPAEGFGDWQEDRVSNFPRCKLSEYDLEPGLILSFADPSGERPGVVKEVLEEAVVVDFNHPLAGEELTFEVLIHSVENS